MDKVKYAPVISKYTSNPVDKLHRRAANIQTRQEGALYWLGVGGMFALYLVVMICAILGVVVR